MVELESQYRCSSSGNYISWLDSIFGSEETEEKLEEDFDFKLV